MIYHKKTSWLPIVFIPQFHLFVKEVYIIVTVNVQKSLLIRPFLDNLVPQEILDRGITAQKAYEMALKSGRTKARRILIMLIGQSRAGKTSLLRSLKGKALMQGLSPYVMTTCIHVFRVDNIK
jgi:polynucleotide 5'-kinase involved in rRNA processing